jgi:hypothetical protein
LRLHKKGMITNFFHPSLFLLFLDPGWVKIRIRDKHPGSATLGQVTGSKLKKFDDQKY